MLGIKQINQARVSKQYYTSILNYPLSFGLNRTEEISTLRIEKLSKKKKKEGGGGGERPLDSMTRTRNMRTRSSQYQVVN